MKLDLLNGPNRCVAASLAMITNLSIETIVEELFTDLRKPFEPPFQEFEKVPSMVEVCEWMHKNQLGSLMPFPKAPTCSVAITCTPVPVYENAEAAWLDHIEFGSGLLEGETGRLGHMCAWDGYRVFDPRGYRYEIWDAPQFDFSPHTFWLHTR